MSETTLLRNNAIRNNASVGATPPHGPVKTGELPLVQVKTVPSAPQIRESQQQKTVSILAPNSKGAVTSGELPMVQVKMTQNGPQVDDGQDQPVVIKDGKTPVSAGGLPMVQVKMEGGRPQVQTLPNVQGGPPRIPGAAPAMSTPRAAQPGVTRVAAPLPAATPLPELPAFTTEELMLFQHALTKYVGELSAADESADAPEAVQIAKDAIAKIDDALVAIAVHAEAVANGTYVPPVAQALAPTAHYVAPRVLTGGYFSQAAIAPSAPVPAPRRGGYVAQQPSVRKTQLNSGLVPRGVRRGAPAGTLPTVIVKMDGQRATVQNQAEVDAAREALAATTAEATEG